MNAVHLSTAVRMLESPDPVDITVLTRKGELRHYERVVGLKRQHYSGTRNIKFLNSGEIRKIRDCLLLEINGMEVFM